MKRIHIVYAVVILVMGLVTLTSYKLFLVQNTAIRIKIYMGTKDFEEYNAETIAEIFDMSQSVLSQGQRRDYSGKIQEVHKLKPNYKALVYRNIKEIYNYSKEEWRIALADNWLLKDINGQLVSDKQWPENYAVDIGNPDYQKWVANKIKEWLNKNSLFDGVFADNGLNAYVGEWQWNYTKKPINPRSGIYWKDEEVRQAYIALHKEIKKAIGSKLLICNGVFDGKRFYAHIDDYTQVILNSPLDGIMSEGTWQTWPSEQTWLLSLRFLSWVEDNFLKKNSGRYFIPVVNDLLSSGITQEQLTLYGIASTLLGIKSDQIRIGGVLGRRGSKGEISEPKLLPLIRKLRSVHIGKPVNDYYVIPHTRIYARDFTNGKVLVNPTLTKYIISLEKNYYTLEGKLVSDLTMNSHTGEILLIKSR